MKSLLNQHNKFIEKQKKDGFVLEYMNWLGHYEFGLNQKYFSIENKIALNKYDKSGLDYWIASWINYHFYVSQLLDTAKICLVSYEDLLKKPVGLIDALERHLGIQLAEKSLFKFRPNAKSINESFEIDGHLLKEAHEIYNHLISKKLNITRAQEP